MSERNKATNGDVYKTLVRMGHNPVQAWNWMDAALRAIQRDEEGKPFLMWDQKRFYIGEEK